MLKCEVNPIPATTSITASWPALPLESNGRVTVYDMLGRQLIQENVASSETQRTVEVGHLPVGVYFLVISDRGRPMHRAKIIIQY